MNKSAAEIHKDLVRKFRTLERELYAARIRAEKLIRLERVSILQNDQNDVRDIIFLLQKNVPGQQNSAQKYSFELMEKLESRNHNHWPSRETSWRIAEIIEAAVPNDYLISYKQMKAGRKV